MVVLRMLRRSPGFTAVAVCTLALGIGAGTAVFSVVDAVFLRPLPYKDDARLTAIWKRSSREKELTKLFTTYRDFERWKNGAHTFENISAATWATGGRVWTGHGVAQEVLAIPVSTSFFETLGVRAARGRTFAAPDAAAGCSVVLSDGFWRNSLGADPNVAGRSLVLDERDCTVLGVMPASFSFYPPSTKMWMLIDAGFQPDRDHLIVGVFARLKSGVTLQQAQQELSALHGAIHAGDARELELAPVIYGLRGEFTWLASRDLPKTVMLLAGAVGFLLLIACVNVANLLLARWTLRQRELTVRAALGAGRARIVRQVLAEGMWLSAMATALGCLLAFAAVRYLQSVNAVEMPVGAVIAIRWPVLVFAALLCTATTLITGLVPAWRVSKVDLNAGLKAAGRGLADSGLARRSSQILIVAEMTASVVLLWGGGLLLQSVLRMEDANLGFDPRGVLAGRVTLPRSRYAGAQERLRLWEQLERRIGSLTRPEDVALVSRLAPYGGGSQIVEIAGRAPQGAEAHDTGGITASPSYFRVMREPLLRGRSFEATDRADTEPVAIVNRALVQTYFAGADPLGQRIRLKDRDATPWMTIVGVVGNEKHWPLLQEVSWVESPGVFRPAAQDPGRSMEFVVRTAGGARELSAAIGRAVSAMDPGVPLAQLETMEERLAKPLSYPRFRAVLLAAFSTCALVLAAVGLYGVLSQLVAFRTREFGVRRAVGAQTPDLILLVARVGGVPVAIGLAAGIGCALAFGRLMKGLLYGLKPDDPATLAAIPVVLLVVAVTAMAVPARRASRIDPMTALREE
jgi:putative ABC transport system permease protein